MFKNIILSGGVGSRLWPISRQLFPKQFIKLLNNKSLFQNTLERNFGLVDSVEIITNKEQFFLVIDQVTELNKEIRKIFIEPIGKNTAPAIALSAILSDENDLLLITPSDHLIAGNYEEAIAKAKKLAEEGYIVIFGIKPTKPEVGYGYIEAKGNDVIKFYEKPSIEKAEEYINKGYLWNSGIFMFKTGTFLNELKSLSYEVYKKSFDSVNNSLRREDADLEVIEIKQEDMEQVPNISFDYAILEKSQKIKVIEVDFKWSDLGSFDSLFENYNKDKSNSLKIVDKLIEINAKNNFILSDKLVSLIDIEDLIIIDTSDALLVAKRGSSQKVKDIVKELKKLDLKHYREHNLVHRPWGHYEVLLESKNYKIKKIFIKPHKKLSLQKHKYRNEHWVVIKGKAFVRIGPDEFELKENESAYVKKGQLHRLENKTNKPLLIIEVQMGSYLGEDDIIRLADDFNRT
jgi:mannose-1-phosphate guanylyltransferase